MKWLRLVLALGLLPLALGQLVVTYEDATSTHWPGRAVIGEQLRHGRFPFLNPAASCGQPLAGNPNFGVFFPDTLLVPLLPLPVSFGLRFALPFILGFVGARRWARVEGASRNAAETAAWAFVLSGVFLSAWRFYNTGLALSVSPWVMAAAARLARRSTAPDPGGLRRAGAELALWSALEVAAGEPVVLVLTAFLVAARTVPALLAFRRGRRPGSGGLDLLGSLAATSAIAAALAAPQIAATAQILPDSARGRAPFAFYTATGSSVFVGRLKEQVVPFPWGRPDLRAGPGAYTPHDLFDGHPPYLWTLHLGLPTLGLLLLLGRPLDRREWMPWLVALLAVVLSFGRHLPGAKSLLFPGLKLWRLLSLDGRIRFPVKWWYAVALLLIPLVAWAAERWHRGELPSPARRAAAAMATLVAGAILAWSWPSSFLAALGPVLGVVALAALAAAAGTFRGRQPAWLGVTLCAVLLANGLPLLLALVDRPPAPPPSLPGRLFVQVEGAAYPPASGSAPAEPVRDFFRRSQTEMRPLTSAATGGAYAFDDDPDGAYADWDWAVHGRVAAMPWPERAHALRLAGVTHVVSDQPLTAPYQRVADLIPGQVWLYSLAGTVRSVRFATRVVRRRSLDAVLAFHRSSLFDPTSDVLLLGEPGDDETVHRSEVRPTTRHESADRLVTEVDAPTPGVLVWSRTYFSAWKATVDGRPATTLLADGHFVGVPVPSGRHRVVIAWSAGPVVWASALAALGLAGLFWMWRGAVARRPEAA